MTVPLAVEDFAGFFEEVHGVPPFPWQDRLLRRLAANEEWPSLLDLPTGSGKTATLDIAVFHLALDAARGGDRKAPLRIAFVVDRRLIVDDAFGRARKIANALSAAKDPVTGRVAAALRMLGGGDEKDPPLLARRLRGGVPREDDWARTPVQPTILCSTVDQVGSRLLFRGYGVSDRMKPVHAGLLGTDCLILLDEAHLAEPFRQTLEAVKRLGKAAPEQNLGLPLLTTAVLTATPDKRDEQPFGLEADDCADPILSRRLQASKPARLIDIVGKQGVATEDRRVEEIVEQVNTALKQLRETLPNAAIGVVVNRVLRARRIFERLKQQNPEAEVTLLIGPAREVDRDARADELDRIRTGNKERRQSLQKPFVVVATQTIEAGVDIDFDALITEAAPLDALRQRFGRLNRDGRPVPAFAAILAHRDDIGAKADDPVYGNRTGETWQALQEASKETGVVDFGITAFPSKLLDQSEKIATKKESAPIVMPAYAHLWSQTWPRPDVDPDVSLFLHGPNRSPATVQIAWRADLFSDSSDQETVELLRLVPLKPGEMLEVSVAAARRWLRNAPMVDFADAPEKGTTEDSAGDDRRIFRWAGPGDDRTGWILPGQLRPNDVIAVPADYGGCDEYGWNPYTSATVMDVAELAAQRFASRCFIVRLTPALIYQSYQTDSSFQIGEYVLGLNDVRTEFENFLEQNQEATTIELLNVALELKIYGKLRFFLQEIFAAKRLQHCFYNEDQDGGVVFIAPLGLDRADTTGDLGAIPATEIDEAGSFPGYTLTLDQHSDDVSTLGRGFAELARLPEALTSDIALSGYLHDTGKLDPRFQAYLAGGGFWGWDGETVLAKSGKNALSPNARTTSGLPNEWRHEVLSVRLAPFHDRFEDEARDQLLVLWLIGVHHGLGRPFFRHTDPLDSIHRDDLPAALDTTWQLPPGLGPQSLGFDFAGYDWPQMFQVLKGRYGIWGLAALEAFVRLADHRASEAAGLAAKVAVP